MDSAPNVPGIQKGPNGSSKDAEQRKQAAEQQEMVKNSILKQVMDQNAFARLSNLAAVKPETASAVENLVVQLARSGQLGGKLTDEGFKDLLNKVSIQQQKPKTTVKFDRRRAALDSDDDDY